MLSSIDVRVRACMVSKNVLAKLPSRRMINKEPFVKEAAQTESLCETMMLNGPKLLPEKHKAIPPLNPAFSCSSFPDIMHAVGLIQPTVGRHETCVSVSRDARCGILSEGE